VRVFDEATIRRMVCLLTPRARGTTRLGRVVWTRVSQKGSAGARDIRSLTLLFVICLLDDRFKRDSGLFGSSNKLNRLGEGLDPSVIT
jgi:hypothetical protein